MGRTKGAKDGQKRTRSLESASSKARKKAARQAAGERSKAAMLAAIRSAAPGSSGSSAGPSNSGGQQGGTSAATALGDGGNGSDDDDSVDESAIESAAADAQPDEPEAEAQHHEEAQPTREPSPRRDDDADRDVDAELDDDEQVDDIGSEPGVVSTYLKAVFERVHSEVCGADAARVGSASSKWLLEMLKQDEWWLRAHRNEIHRCGPCLGCLCVRIRAARRPCGNRKAPDGSRSGLLLSHPSHMRKRVDVYARVLHCCTRTHVRTSVHCRSVQVSWRNSRVSSSFPSFLRIFIILSTSTKRVPPKAPRVC